jgi:ketosteroid isomerase-like protein
VFGQIPAAREQNLRALVSAETAFAQAAATKGTRDAFLEFLADDGVVFQPAPVNGKEFWRQREPRKGLLSWHPTYADVSAAGDLGYTTGPYEFRPGGPNDRPVAFGQYFTIWKRQSNGDWRAVLDRGISYSHPSQTPAELQFARNMPSDIRRAADGKSAIMKAEYDFADTAEHGSDAAAAYLADDVRVLRDGSLPAAGKAAAVALLAQGIQGIRAQRGEKPTFVDISRSGDLGYTYGAFEATFADGTKTKGIYVRVWKGNGKGEFKIVIDIQVPNPPK